MRICHLLLAALSFVAAQNIFVPTSLGQISDNNSSVHQNFGQNQRIRLIAGTSRVIKFDFVDSQFAI